MNEAVTKRFLLYFRLMLLAWILIANAIIHVTGMEYSWLIFLSNIMMFTLEGDVKDRFWTVELGGLVGLVLTVVALLSITALTPVLGAKEAEAGNISVRDRKGETTSMDLDAFIAKVTEEIRTRAYNI